MGSSSISIMSGTEKEPVPVPFPRSQANSIVGEYRIKFLFKGRAINVEDGCRLLLLAVENLEQGIALLVTSRD